jgi:hypothetical protein
MPRKKGSRDSKPRKQRVFARGADMLDECRRRFRERFGRDFTEDDKADVLEAVGSTPSSDKWRGGLQFVASHHNLTFAPRGTLREMDLAVLSFLCGKRVLPRDKEQPASVVLKDERSSFDKQRKFQQKLDEATAVFAEDVTAAASPAVQWALRRMHERGVAEQKDGLDFDGARRDLRIAIAFADLAPIHSSRARSDRRSKH